MTMVVQVILAIASLIGLCGTIVIVKEALDDAWPKCAICGKREWSHKTKYHRFFGPIRY